jgi:ubiquinone biosynthesis protein
MIKELLRLGAISKIFIKYKLYRLSKLNHLPKSSVLYKELAVNLRLALEQLGPIFIKFGQLLSTRHEALPPEFIIELSKLQDSVAPFDTVIAKNIIKSEFNKEADEIFTDFSNKPIASASVAQVHTAKLNNELIIVKILRPDLVVNINRDLRLLQWLINIGMQLLPNISRFKPDELLVELERVLIDEQDLLREAANASQLRRNFEHNNILYIPKVYWAYSSKNVLVLEKITGISINNIQELKEKNVDLKLLAKRGVELFFTQVFEHCLFHGDLHPGNIFVNAKDPKDPKFYAVDFGIMGSLGPKEQYYLAHNLWAFLNRDYRAVAKLHIESGWVDADTRLDLFEAAIRTVSEPILELPVSEISFGKLLVKLFDVAKSFNMQLQPQLLVFKKSLINVEGIAHQLDPNLDLWHTSKPFVENWMRKQLGVRGIYSKLKNDLPVLSKIIFETPELVHAFLAKNVNNNSVTQKQSVRKKDFLSKKASLILIFIAIITIFMLNYNDILFMYTKYSYGINNTCAFILLFMGIKGYFFNKRDLCQKN